MRRIPSIKLFKFHKSGNKIMLQTSKKKVHRAKHFLFCKIHVVRLTCFFVFLLFLNEYNKIIIISYCHIHKSLISRHRKRHGKKCHSKQTAKILFVCAHVYGYSGMIGMIPHTVVSTHDFSFISNILIAFKAAHTLLTVLGDMKMMMMMSYCLFFRFVIYLS